MTITCNYDQLKQELDKLSPHYNNFILTKTIETKRHFSLVFSNQDETLTLIVKRSEGKKAKAT